MKKFLALLLSAVMLLSAGAYACADGDSGDHSHVLSNVYIVVDDQVIDLSDVSVELDVAADGRAGRVHLDVGGESVAELGLTVADGLYVLHMESETLGHKDFAVDPVVVLTNVIQGGIDDLTELLESIDAEGLARSIVDGLMAPKAAEPEESEEPVSMPEISIEGDVLGVILDCFSEPETAHMGGTEYAPNGDVFEMPDGEYTVTSFSCDTDTVCQILDMICADGEPLGLGEAFKEAGLELAIDVVSYEGDEASSGQVSYSVSDGQYLYTVGLGYDQLATEAGATTNYVVTMTQSNDSDAVTGVALGFTVSDGTHEGEQFTPDEVDMDQVVMLSDMDLEQALTEVADALSVMGGDLEQPITDVLMAATEGMTVE